MNGEVLGNRYELLEKVGEGGMAIVYKARCNKLNRFVAVKILKKEFADNKEIVDKFKDEAMAVAKFSDSNIVNVLDVGSDDNINYIVMEFVNGKTLKEVVEQFGKLSSESTITIAMQVANALDCAHKNGIVHRDIKPQNILVTEDGIVKVTDFGIAKSADSATLTNTSTILGSAHYFSPEQAKGSVVDNRSDIYSLGVVMYEMLTGKVPFEADSPVTIALKHIQEEAPSPKVLNPKVSEGLSKIVLKCMAKNVNDRYKNVKELIADLQKIKANPETDLEEKLSSVGGETIIMAPIKDEDLGEVDENLDEDYDDYDEELYDELDENYDEHEVQEVKEKPKKQEKKKDHGVRNLLLGIGVAIISLVLIIGGFFMLVQTKPKVQVKEVQIPNVIGVMQNDATTTLQGKGLEVNVKQVDSSEKAGTVISVNPSVGTSVKEGTTVELDVSKGEKEISMPDVTNISQGDAEAQLKGLGFTLILSSNEYSDSVPKGNVIATTPEPGTPILKTSSITLIVSSGPKYKEQTIPDLKGMTQAQATKALNALNVNVNISTEPVTDKSLDGKVISFSPGVGTKVKEGSSVSIEIGKYEEQKVQIPTVTGQTKDAAVAALNAAGFQNISIADKYDATVQAGQVISQSTGMALPSASISLVISKGPNPETTPPTPPTDPKPEDEVGTQTPNSSTNTGTTNKDAAKPKANTTAKASATTEASKTKSKQS